MGIMGFVDHQELVRRWVSTTEFHREWMPDAHSPITLRFMGTEN
jgi:hypothetical protein